METINIELQVATTGKYTLDEFVAKIKDYADKLSNTISNFFILSFNIFPYLSL